MKGVVKQSKHVYERITKIYPIKKDYGDDYYKYICPICDKFNNKHQLIEGSKNCPLCGVNLYWGDED